MLHPVTQAERLAELRRWEGVNLVDPKCEVCRREFYSRTDVMPSDVFAPRHHSGANCRSGGHPHCTCDSCF
jgi:hypothetical protein